MEMFSSDKNQHRYISNELPKWAIAAHIALIIFLTLFGLAGIIFSIYIGAESGIVYFLFLLIAGILIISLAIFAYKNLRKYLDNAINIQLREDGYFYRYHNKKENRTGEILLPYETIDYVLIGKSANTTYRTTYSSFIGMRHKLSWMVSARFMIKGEDKILDFTSSNQQFIDDWIRVFQEKHVPLFHTECGVKVTPNTPEAIEAIPKQKYAGKLAFQPGEMMDELDFDDEFLTEQQKQLTQKRNNKKKYAGIVLGLVHIPLVMLVFPQFPVEDGTFASESDMLPWIVTLLALYFFNFRKIKWYQPLLDSLILVLCISIAAIVTPGVTEEFKDAVFFYMYTVIAFFLVGKYFFMIFKWVRKKL
ncbi:hypothetical protein SAMN04487944_11676 [Gracilibacillus ureilyticus]|uniref:Uncharacterized protein n=1 Tax=Gracilibacillus ureilyticus TaxID=531814 RepID=A0A1H9U862_9BACI|nr:hypothetical protein [Gracilibacillus ureilyticus]SES05512.1 hypothetical protein SAMN04487944_11676 [Gracilibacillus ureilyticus]